MAATGDYTVRVATREEVDIAVDWAAAEGWNPGLHDAPSFHAADPSGFLVGMLGNEPVATVSVVKYGKSFGFLGFYIVKPEHRGHGFGLRIWQAGMASLAGRLVGLDGVPAQQDNYRKSGFELAWNNVRHEGVADAAPFTDARVVPLASVPFEQVAGYDAAFFPANRKVFLRCWIGQPLSTALGFVESGLLKGYGMLRPCRTGSKIGPLFADSPQVAESLFAGLIARAPAGTKVYLDTPSGNAHAMSLAERHGMKPVFETARMYTGASPPVPMDRLYGITSFELG